MKAVVFHGVGDIRLDTIKDPKIEKPTDAIVRITTSAICGTDLHMIRGTMPGMQEGTVIGHEAVGEIEEVGEQVTNFRKGDRVIIPSTIGCGCCNYCRSGYFAQCDEANPNGKLAGTSFYGGPESTGPFNGLQAEFARVPNAHVNLVGLPHNVEDEEAILLSDIFPTGYFGADLAEVGEGDTVAVFGCGPVGLFAIASAQLLGATRVFGIDNHPSRLKKAQELHAEVINFSEADPVEALRDLTMGSGVDRVIDAVGIDAFADGPGVKKEEQEQFWREMEDAAPDRNPNNGNWHPGNAPSLALRWGVDALAKAGSLGIIGVYAPGFDRFPIGMAMNKNLTVKMGNCNHRAYIPDLLRLVQSSQVQPTRILTQREPLNDVIEAYKTFDKREEGWVKVALNPVAQSVAR